MLATRVSLGLLVAAALVMPARSVQADSCCETKCCETKCKEVKGNLCCLSAKVECNSCDLTVCAKYYVCLRHADCGAVDVVLTAYYCDRVVGQTTVPATGGCWPTRQSASLNVPAGSVSDPSCLRIKGELVERCSHRVL